MEITSISVQKEERENSRVIGYAEIVFDNCLKINGIRIIKGNEKIFAAMPNKKLPDGSFKDMVHPINKEFRDIIDEAVRKEYENLN